MNDTSPRADQRYRELLRQASPARRFDMCGGLITASREMALAGLRIDLPDATDQELRVALARRLYGSEIAERIFRQR